MKLLLASLLLLLIPANAVTECDVYPCSLDIVTVVDSTRDMGTDDNVGKEFDFVKKLGYGWSYGFNEQFLVRMAIVGNGILHIVDTTDYYTNERDLMAKLDDMKTKASKYGLPMLHFDDMLSWVSKKYTAAYPFAARSAVGKRILIFTATTNTTAVANAVSSAKLLRDSGFQMVLVKIGTQIDFSALQPYKTFSIDDITNIPSSLVLDLINNGICSGQAHSCPAKTAPIYTTRAARTVPTTPALPDGDYLTCACTPDTMWIDIVFVIDISLSMGPSGILQIQSEIGSLISWLTLDNKIPQHTRIGFVTFADNAKIVSPLNQYNDLDSIFDVLFDIQSNNDRSVDIVSALQQARWAFTASQDRENARNVIALFSSAYSDRENPKEIAAQLEASGYYIITFAFEKSGETDVVEAISELASPGMAFNNKEHQTLEHVVQAMCLANCYCEKAWNQLQFHHHNFAECFMHERETILKTWDQADAECRKMNAHEDSQLVYINSVEKQDYVDAYARRYGMAYGYHIGLRYDHTIGKYKWLNDVVDLPYVSWAPNYPDLSKGDCVTTIKNGSSIVWINEVCDSTTNKHAYVCQAQACDTDHYCEVY